MPGVIPNLKRIMLDPAGLRKNLAVLALGAGDDRAVAKKNATRGRRSLIDRGDEFHGRMIADRSEQSLQAAGVAAGNAN
jgi:hypothetical protein